MYPHHPGQRHSEPGEPSLRFGADLHGRDTESGACRAITNGNLHHDHGMCQPLAQLAGERLDAMVVGRIGMGAFGKLKAASIRVYQSEHPTVEETVAAFKTGSLREVTPATACAHHGNGPHGRA